MDVVHGIDLGRGGFLPGEAKCRHAALHLAEHETGLFANAGRGHVPQPHDMIAIIAAALRRFAAAGDDERRFLAWSGFGVAEGVERRLGRWLDRRADIAARHRIGLAVEYLPALQGADVDLVEGGKAAFAEGAGDRSSQAQNAVSGRFAAPMIFSILPKPSSSGTGRRNCTRTMRWPGSAATPAEYWKTPSTKR